MGVVVGQERNSSSKHKSITNKLIENLVRNQRLPKINIPQIRRETQIYLIKLQEIEKQIEAIREYLCDDCKKIFDIFYPVIKHEVAKYDFLKNPIKCILTVGRFAAKYGINKAFAKYPYWSKSRISKIKHAYLVLHNYLYLFEDLDLTLDQLITISYEIENYEPSRRKEILIMLVELLKKYKPPRKTESFRNWIRVRLKELMNIKKFEKI